MLRSTRVAALSALLSAVVLAIAPAGAAEPKAPPEPAAKTPGHGTRPSSRTLQDVARRLVVDAASVQEGEIVLVTGGARDAELLENIAVEVRRAGAFPLVQLASDRMARRAFDASEKYDAQEPALDLMLADTVDVAIGVDSNESENAFEGADARRLVTIAKAAEGVPKRYLKNNVRQVAVGNNLYPTRWRAAHYGMSLATLSRTFWGGVDVDYTALQETGKKVSGTLAAGKDVRITSPAGTDLTLSVAGRKWLVSDGIISPEDRKAGGANVLVYLPAGEVFAAPVKGTASGKVVVPVEYHRGQKIRNLTYTFANGRVTGITGQGPGFASFKAFYDAQTGRKDELGFVDFGINPNVTLPSSSPVGTWVPAGMVSVGCGNNIWAGGDNDTPFGVNLFIRDATVTLDGREIVTKGKLKL